MVRQGCAAQRRVPHPLHRFAAHILDHQCNQSSRIEGFIFFATVLYRISVLEVVTGHYLVCSGAVLPDYVIRTHRPRAIHIVPWPSHSFLQRHHVHHNAQDGCQPSIRTAPFGAQGVAPILDCCHQVLVAPAIPLQQIVPCTLLRCQIFAFELGEELGAANVGLVTQIVLPRIHALAALQL